MAMMSDGAQTPLGFPIVVHGQFYYWACWASFTAALFATLTSITVISALNTTITSTTVRHVPDFVFPAFFICVPTETGAMTEAWGGCPPDSALANRNLDGVPCVGVFGNKSGNCRDDDTALQSDLSHLDFQIMEPQAYAILVHAGIDLKSISCATFVRRVAPLWAMNESSLCAMPFMGARCPTTCNVSCPIASSEELELVNKLETYAFPGTTCFVGNTHGELRINVDAGGSLDLRFRNSAVVGLSLAFLGFFEPNSSPLAADGMLRSPMRHITWQNSAISIGVKITSIEDATNTFRIGFGESTTSGITQKTLSYSTAIATTPYMLAKPPPGQLGGASYVYSLPPEPELSNGTFTVITMYAASSLRTEAVHTKKTLAEILSSIGGIFTICKLVYSIFFRREIVTPTEPTYEVLVRKGSVSKHEGKALAVKSVSSRLGVDEEGKEIKMPGAHPQSKTSRGCFVSNDGVTSHKYLDVPTISDRNEALSRKRKSTSSRDSQTNKDETFIPVVFPEPKLPPKRLFWI